MADAAKAMDGLAISKTKELKGVRIFNTGDDLAGDKLLTRRRLRREIP